MTDYSRSFSRRDVLRLGLGTAAAGALAACAAPPPPAAPTAPAAAPTPAPAKPTTAAAAPAAATAAPAAATTAPAAAAQPATPMTFNFLSTVFGTDKLPPYLETFNQQYGDRIELATVPQNYHSVVETRLRAGVDVDMLTPDEGYPPKWYKAGWITDLEGLPGLDKLQQDLLPTLRDASKVDGKMVGLPAGGLTKVMVYNAEVLDKAGLKPATTWDEFYEQGVKMKADRHADFPFVPMWTKAFGLTTYFAIGDSYSRGGKEWFDSTTLEPNYDSDPAVLETLEFWKKLWDAKLVPPDVLTVDHNATTAIFGAGGRAYFQHNVSQSLFPLNTQPDKFAVAGKIKLMMYPGTTHECLTGTNFVCMTPRQEKARTWNAERFLGGTDKNNEYLIALKWRALDTGAEVAYKPIYEDRSVQEAWGKWVDVKLLAEQKEKGRLMGNVTLAPWFPEWLERQTVGLQSAIIGDLSPKDALKGPADFARSQPKA